MDMIATAGTLIHFQERLLQAGSMTAIVHAAHLELWHVVNGFGSMDIGKTKTRELTGNDCEWLRFARTLWGLSEHICKHRG